jgi:hypothetical protein
VRSEGREGERKGGRKGRKEDTDRFGDIMTFLLRKFL